MIQSLAQQRTDRPMHVQLGEMDENEDEDEDDEPPLLMPLPLLWLPAPGVNAAADGFCMTARSTHEIRWSNFSCSKAITRPTGNPDAEMMVDVSDDAVVDGDEGYLPLAEEDGEVDWCGGSGWTAPVGVGGLLFLDALDVRDRFEAEDVGVEEDEEDDPELFHTFPKGSRLRLVHIARTHSINAGVSPPTKSCSTNSEDKKGNRRIPKATLNEAKQLRDSLQKVCCGVDGVAALPPPTRRVLNLEEVTGWVPPGVVWEAEDPSRTPSRITSMITSMILWLEALDARRFEPSTTRSPSDRNPISRDIGCGADADDPEDGCHETMLEGLRPNALAAADKLGELAAYPPLPMTLIRVLTST